MSAPKLTLHIFGGSSPLVPKINSGEGITNLCLYRFIDGGHRRVALNFVPVTFYFLAVHFSRLSYINC